MRKELSDGVRCTIDYEAPDSFDSGSPFVLCPDSTDGECVICLSEMHGKECVALNKCGHRFHKGCIQDALGSHSSCPICRVPAVEPRGKSPSGKMVITHNQQSLGGHGSCGRLVIHYLLQGGVQKNYHTNPGVRYTGTHRDAYLPHNDDGKKLVKRLAYAFSRGLIFMVGTSLTTGRTDQITWASIHHKTSSHGGVHGWPDDGSYFLNCNDELDNLKVPCAEDCPSIFELGSVSKSRPNPNRRTRDSRGRRRNAGPPFQPKTIEYTVPEFLPSINESYIPCANANVTCSKCRSGLNSLGDQTSGRPVALKACGHTFHTNCLEAVLINDHRCPECGVLAMEPWGRGPAGIMQIDYNDTPCPGYEDCGTIYIQYLMQTGLQKSFHPNPGVQYSGTGRSAYLPYNEDGRDLLRRLCFAFQRGLTFSIGTSATSGMPNSITWSTVPHKSHLHGGAFGWPDISGTFFALCNDRLDELNVPPANNCPIVLVTT